MMIQRTLYLILAGCVLTCVTTAAPIDLIDPSILVTNRTVVFDELAGGIIAGTHYDGIVSSGGVQFAERFAGQTVTSIAVGGPWLHDELDTHASGPLRLQPGAAGVNIAVVDRAVWTITGNNVLTGVSADPRQYTGEGSFAFLFPNAVRGFSFRVVGANGGTATLAFFRSDGSLIDTVGLTDLANQDYAFARSGAQDIAGVSLWNADGGGMAIDDLRYSAVPEPSTCVAVGSVLLLMGLRRRG